MKSKTIHVLLAVASIVCGWTAELYGQSKSKSSSSRVSQKDTLWVASAPPGLKVYLSPDNDDPTAKKENKEGWVNVVEDHSAINKRHFKGVTPLLLRNIAPGNYLLAVAPILLLDKNRQKAQIDDTLPVRVLVSFESLKDPKNLQDGLNGAAVYSITKQAGAEQKVLVHRHSLILG